MCVLLLLVFVNIEHFPHSLHTGTFSWHTGAPGFESAFDFKLNVMIHYGLFVCDANPIECAMLGCVIIVNFYSACDLFRGLLSARLRLTFVMAFRLRFTGKTANEREVIVAAFNLFNVNVGELKGLGSL